MNATATRRPLRLPRSTYAWVRQIHLWIGAWGALAAILYGLTGLVLNHHMGENAWPQGKTTPVDETVLRIPAEARETPEQLSLWLRATHQLDATMIRKGGPGSAAPKWTLGGGNAGRSWVLEFTHGSETAELKRNQYSPLVAFNRLHKGIGGKWWILFADSIAIGMLMLGISGIWMWARGRNAREMVVSVMGLATAVFVALVGLLAFV
jgi:hypothetical protein